MKVDSQIKISHFQGESLTLIHIFYPGPYMGGTDFRPTCQSRHLPGPKPSSRAGV